MDEVTIRDLRDSGGEVMQRVEAGESLIVTRAGVSVGELRPVPPPPVDAHTLLQRWRHLPAIDASAFRADVEAGSDTALLG